MTRLLFLTPASIGYLTQGILSLVITGYLLYLAHQAARLGRVYAPTLILAVAFGMMTIFITLFFLDVSLRSNARFPPLYLQNVAVGLCLTALLQFAYHFPSLSPRQKWEARLIFMLCLFYVVWESNLALKRFMLLLNEGKVSYRPDNADYPLAVGFVYLIILLLRQTIRLSQGSRSDWLRTLWRPRGPEARTIRAFALIMLGALILSVVEVFFSQTTMPAYTHELIFSLGILFILFAFALFYINYLPQATTFMVKLMGIALVTLLIALGTLGWVTYPVDMRLANQNCTISDQQTLRFTPNTYGGYDIFQIPFHFRETLGDALRLGDDGESQISLPFCFPIYGQSRCELTLSRNGLVSFGDSPNNIDARYYYTPAPAIFALFVDLNPEETESGSMPSDSGVFMQQSADYLTFTWYRLPLYLTPEHHLSFQLTLYPDGAYEITHEPIPAYTQRLYNSRHTAWIVGASPGVPPSAPHWLHSIAELPFRSQDGETVVVDYYLCFRDHLHRQLAPLAMVILGSSLFILVGFPLFLRPSLIKPLTILLEGIRQVDAGHLNVTMPVQYHDEIGLITESFNGMASQLNTLMTKLEARVHERTLQLEEAKLEAETAKRKAEAANQAKSAFIENINHELRTPLASILAYIETLLEGNPGTLTEIQREFLQTSYDNAQLLSRLIGDLLNVGQSSRKKLALTWKVVDISTLLISLIRSMQPLVEEKAIHITPNLPEGLPLFIEADPQRIDQVISNLLSNAIKFTPSEGHITLILRPTSAQQCLNGQTLPIAGVHLQVADSGRGIPPQDIPHIFERFYRGSNAVDADIQGAGLGLYLAQELVHAHQGLIWAENRHGAGALFHVWLPRYQTPNPYHEHQNLHYLEEPHDRPSLSHR